MSGANTVPHHTAKEHQAALTPQAENATAMMLSGEGRVSALPNLAALEYYKMISYFDNPNHKPTSVGMQGLIDNELTYFKEAAALLENEPSLRAKYGGRDLTAVENLVHFLKQKAANAEADVMLGNAIDNIVGRNMAGKPESTTKNGAGVFKYDPVTQKYVRNTGRAPIA